MSEMGILQQLRFPVEQRGLWPTKPVSQLVTIPVQQDVKD